MSFSIRNVVHQFLFRLVCIHVMLAGCERSASLTPTSGASPQSRSPVILTTFSPMAYFAARIVGEHAVVVCPIPEGEDPIFWTPSLEAVQQYQAADLIVINGAGYEKWVATAALPESRVVDTSESFRREFISYQGTTHSHGGAGQHTHEGIDGHTWMDPRNAIQQSAAIFMALKKRWPAKAQAWEMGYGALVNDLESLDARFEALAKSGAMSTVIASHPAYNYISKRYGIAIHNIALAPGEPLPESAVSAIEQLTREHPARGPKIVLWEEDPLDTTRDRLEKQLGIRCVTFDPCENLEKSAVGSGHDYLAVMRENLARLEVAIANDR